MSEVEHILAVKNKLGEGPVWSPHEQALYWVDIENNRFYRFYPATGKHEFFDVGVPVGVLALRASGGLVITSAWTELGEEQRKNHPLAGDLFRLKTGVKGQVRPKFAG